MQNKQVVKQKQVDVGTTLKKTMVYIMKPLKEVSNKEFRNVLTLVL